MNTQQNDGALDFMKKFVDTHSIVSTGRLTELQIAEARMTGRLYVEPDGGLGWAAMPIGVSPLMRSN